MKQKLLARDAEDLAVFAAYLQDMMMQQGALSYQAEKRRFAFAGLRFCHEMPKPHRVRCGVHFNGVQNVETLRFAKGKRGLMLSLLTIGFEGGEETEGRIRLIFAGEKDSDKTASGEICLHVEAIDGVLSDMDEPYATKRVPDHREVGG
ncbi:MAG: DUF2948 family protein [Parvibaculales bacterium]